MRTMMRTLTIVAFVAALALAVGCEDTPLTAGKDFTMTLVAKPATVFIDPAQGVNTANTSIVASVLDSTGVPQKGITVFFSNTGGVLASGNAGVTTDSGGIAADVLTVRVQDAAEISVTATSATLAQTVKVTKTTVATNHPPVAKIVASPSFEQAIGLTVVFDGSTSSDPDAGDGVAGYSWVITSDDPTQSPISKTGATISLPGFPNAQTLTVVLNIIDYSNFPATASMTYFIKAVRSCTDNTPPTAVIAGAATQTKFGLVGSTVHFLLDGTLSSDFENAIQTYTWTCGNGAIGNASTVTCDYLVGSASQTYTATLVVKDQGFGLPGLECQQVSAPASVQVVVSPTTLSGL